MEERISTHSYRTHATSHPPLFFDTLVTCLGIYDIVDTYHNCHKSWVTPEVVCSNPCKGTSPHIHTYTQHSHNPAWRVQTPVQPGRSMTMLLEKQ